MADQSYNVSYSSVQVNGQLVSVPVSTMFRPNAAIGPTARGNGAAGPATIPLGLGAGSSQPEIANVAGGGSSLMRLGAKGGLILGGMFLAGFLLLKYVHWAG